MEKLKSFFGHRVWRILFFIAASLFAVLAIYNLIALFSIHVSCSYYKGLLHSVLSYLYWYSGIAVFILFLIVFIHAIVKKQWKFCLMVAAIFTLEVIGFIFVFGEDLFYCFLYGVNLEGFYWGPH